MQSSHGWEGKLPSLWTELKWERRRDGRDWGMDEREEEAKKKEEEKGEEEKDIETKNTL